MNTSLHNKVLDALKKVMDPDLKKDLVTLNMIKDLSIKGDRIQFTLVLTTPACPFQEMLKKQCIEAIQGQLAEKFHIDIAIDAQVTSQRVKETVLPNVKNIIAIASGKGGVGKSTMTANIAIALAKLGAKVGIIDADIFGPSIPMMFNCAQERPSIIQKEGKNYLVPLEQYGVQLLSIGFLTSPDDAVVWRGPMASSALKQFLKDTDWGDLDYLLIDLPPGTSDIHLTLVQSVVLTGALIVTTPQKIATADAKKGIAMFQKKQINVPIVGIIENMAYYASTEMTQECFLFGKDGGKNLAAQYNIPFLGQVPLLQSICEGSDHGYPVTMKDNQIASIFTALATALAQQIAIHNTMPL